VNLKNGLPNIQSDRANLAHGWLPATTLILQMDQFFFILAVLTVLAAPGPTNTLFAASGASVGILRSLRLAPAGIGGYLFSITALDILVGHIVALHPLTLPALKVSASLWLFYCALNLWRDGRPGFSGATAPISIRQVFFTTLTNPKSLVFAFAIFPQSPVIQLLPWFVEFGLLVFFVAFLWIGMGALIARSVGALATPLRIKRAAAIGLAAFATIFASSVIAAVL
jgi:threonine/homoserine/homoserine lactone efflux protein